MVFLFKLQYVFDGCLLELRELQWLIFVFLSLLLNCWYFAALHGGLYVKVHGGVILGAIQVVELQVQLRIEVLIEFLVI